MRNSRLLVLATGLALMLGMAGTAHAEGLGLPQPTVHFDGFQSSPTPRHGVLIAEISEGSAATAIVFTFADNAPAPDLTPDTMIAMSAIAPIGPDSVPGAYYGYLDWDAYSTRNFAVYTTDGQGSYSQPTYYSVASLSESSTDPGPHPGFGYSWTWGNELPELWITMQHDPNPVMYGFLSQGNDPAADVPTAFANDLEYRYIDFGHEGATFTPRESDAWLDLTTGAALTLTVFRFNADFTHYTRSVYPMVAGRPTHDVVVVSGKTTRVHLGDTTFHVQTDADTLAYYQSEYRLQYRTPGKPWKDIGEISGSRAVPGAFTISSRAHGYQVRAILLTAGANLPSAAHTLVLKRKLKLDLYHKAPAGTTRTMTGVATGRKKGQTVVIQRCRTSKSACSHFKTVRLSSDEHFSLKVPVPRTPGQAWFYRSVLKANDAWTPRVVSSRVHVVAL